MDGSPLCLSLSLSLSASAAGAAVAGARARRVNKNNRPSARTRARCLSPRRGGRRLFDRSRTPKRREGEGDGGDRRVLCLLVSRRKSRRMTLSRGRDAINDARIASPVTPACYYHHYYYYCLGRSGISSASIVRIQCRRSAPKGRRKGVETLATLSDFEFDE